MKIDDKLLRKIIEGALLAAGGPLNINKIANLFEPPEGADRDVDVDPDEKPSKEEILAALEDIQADCKDRGFELKEVGSGWRFQIVQETAPWISRLWEEKPQKYSRALLETLALIAYRQPITRGDIESIRGVAVSSTIIKTLTEREWVKVVGHRDVPGRPALYATTRQFLDYFDLKSLDELPSLKEIQDLDQLDSDMSLKEMLGPPPGDGDAANDAASDQPELESAEAESDQSEPADHDDSAEQGTADNQSAPASESPSESGESVADDQVDQEAAEADDVSGSSEYADEIPADDFDQTPAESDDDYDSNAEDAGDVGDENPGQEWNEEAESPEDSEVDSAELDNRGT